MKKNTLLVTALLLSACSGRIDHSKPAPQPYPDSWQQQQGDESQANDIQWWRAFDSPELDDLIDIALSFNHDLIAATARVEESRQLAKSYGAQRLPSLSASAQLQRNLLRPEAATSTSGATTYSAGLVAMWEIDLWGRVKNRAAASDYQYHGAREDLTNLQHSIAAEVATAWLQLLALHQDKTLLEQQRGTEEIALELIEARFKQNITSSLDVLKQRQALTSVKRSIPNVLQNIAITENRLRLLLGTYPSDILDSSTTQLPVLPIKPALELPSTVITARPDVKKAWYSVLASDTRLAVAKANRLPALSLSASGDFASTQSSRVFKNWSSNLVASLLAPLFDGGRLSALQKAEEQRLLQSLSNYTKTVHTALAEVENSLIAEKYEADFASLLTVEIKQNRTFLTQAAQHYTNGLIDYLEVMRNRKSLNELERALIIVKLRQLKARVALYRSIAGNAPIIESKAEATGEVSHAN